MKLRCCLRGGRKILEGATTFRLIYKLNISSVNIQGQVINPGGGGTPQSGLYGKAPPERDAFFKLTVYKRVGKLPF